MTTVWECFGWCWVITHFKAVSWNIMSIFKFKQTWTWAYTCGCTMEQMAFRTQFTWLAVIMLCLWHFIEEFQVEMKGRCRSNWKLCEIIQYINLKKWNYVKWTLNGVDKNYKVTTCHSLDFVILHCIYCFVLLFHKVIVEKAPKARIGDLDKKKYLVPSDLTGLSKH